MIPKAPPIESDHWLTAAPAEAGFEDRVTALVFFSASCEASWARIEELSLLADRLPGLELVGVHTPRYAHERDGQFVREQLARRDVGFSVVHDATGELWGRYNPGGWPATILVDDRGRAIGASRGLDDLGPIEETAQQALLSRHTRRRRLRTAHIIEPAAEPSRPAPARTTMFDERHALAWPSGLCALDDDRLAVVDAAGRVLILRLGPGYRRAQVEQIVGWLDRPSRVAAWGPDSVIVSLPSTGRVIGIDLDAPEPILLAEDLGRPQGLTTDKDGSIVVCDAGDEQLLRITLEGTVGVIAGTSFTGLVDGPAATAELAQPVAAARSARGILFCDAGSNNLRILTDGGRVHTVTDGGINRLGLVDGPAHRAVLQRPTGLTVLPDGRVIIADSGNHRLRVLDDNRLTTLRVAGLRSPEDVASLGHGVVAVADTFNHRVVCVDLDHHHVWTLGISGLRSRAV